MERTNCPGIWCNSGRVKESAIEHHTTVALLKSCEELSFTFYTKKMKEKKEQSAVLGFLGSRQSKYAVVHPQVNDI